MIIDLPVAAWIDRTDHFGIQETATTSAQYPLESPTLERSATTDLRTLWDVFAREEA